jgi:RNA polymerase sigma-70 factor (ECF subfamily)
MDEPTTTISDPTMLVSTRFGRSDATDAPTGHRRHDAAPTVATRHPAAADVTPLREIDDVDAAFSKGGAGALELAYDAYGTMVFTMCRRVLGPDLAADATQEVFVSAWRAHAQFDPQRGSLAGWLTGITRHRIVDVLRAQQRHKVVGDVAPDSEATPAAAVDDIVERVLLNDALERLPDSSKRLIELAFFEHLTHAEIAERCALPLGTVKSDIRRGLARLRRHMERDHG